MPRWDTPSVQLYEFGQNARSACKNEATGRPPLTPRLCQATGHSTSEARQSTLATSGRILLEGELPRARPASPGLPRLPKDDLEVGLGIQAVQRRWICLT